MNVKNKLTLGKILIISLLCFLCVTVISLTQSNIIPYNPLIKKQAHLAIRAMGDELLTFVHDFDTPVPPIQEIDEHTLRLSFKDPITMNPDSLSWLAMKHITSDIAPKAIIHVLDAKSEEVVYGFEINHVEPKEIPCLGRQLPISKYYVDISFYENQSVLLGLNIFTFGVIGCLLVSLVLLRVYFDKFVKESTPQSIADTTIIQVKGTSLDLNTNQLIFNDKNIKLTNKEIQIFSILFKNEGQLVSREYLTQEVWLKEGVVTSRSLDMYISRLRKKVKALANAEILNQHGKGYILKVS